jgi:hypothetical protein
MDKKVFVWRMGCVPLAFFDVEHSVQYGVVRSFAQSSGGNMMMADDRVTIKLRSGISHDGQTLPEYIEPVYRIVNVGDKLTNRIEFDDGTVVIFELFIEEIDR